MAQPDKIIKFEEKRVVKADIEKGFDRTAHDLTDALAHPPVKLNARQYQILFFIISKTYRYHKKVDWITNTQIADGTGIAANHVSELIKNLVSKNVLLKEGKYIGINPLISDWEEEAKTEPKTPKNGTNKNSQKREVKVPKMGVVTPKNGTKNSQKREPQKKNTITKEYITKEIVLPPGIPHSDLIDFVEHRKQKKAPLTEIQLERFVKKIVKLDSQGYDVPTILDESISNGWTGIFPKDHHLTKGRPATSTGNHGFTVINGGGQDEC